MISNMLMFTLFIAMLNVSNSNYYNNKCMWNNSYINDIQNFYKTKQELKTYYYKRILFQTNWVFKNNKYSIVLFKNTSDFIRSLSFFTKNGIIRPAEYPDFNTIYQLLM